MAGSTVMLLQSNENFCMTRKELLVIIRSLDHFHRYLFSSSPSELTIRHRVGCGAQRTRRDGRSAGSARCTNTILGTRTRAWGCGQPPCGSTYKHCRGGKFPSTSVASRPSWSHCRSGHQKDARRTTIWGPSSST